MFCYSNPIVRQDLTEIITEPLPWHLLAGKTILITGINSMLGTYLGYFLLTLNRTNHLNMRVIGLSRSPHVTNKLFSDFLGHPDFETLIQDVTEPIHVNGDVDYIFHFAGNASPRAIVNDPVGILKANILGGINVLELAREKGSERVILASTREVYGRFDGDSLSETTFGTIDPMEPRSCYPESKRAMETLATAYFHQYGVPSVSARIAHSYGPGMKTEGDGRVMADFIGDAINNRDIRINSSGEAERAFIYLSDTITALLYLTFNAEPGTAYNLANETEPKPIKEIARLIAETQGSIKVSILHTGSQAGYCNYRRTPLDTSKLEALGFSPKITLSEGIRRTLKSFQ